MKSVVRLSQSSGNQSSLSMTDFISPKSLVFINSKMITTSFPNTDFKRFLLSFRHIYIIHWVLPSDSAESKTNSSGLSIALLRRYRHNYHSQAFWPQPHPGWFPAPGLTIRSLANGNNGEKFTHYSNQKIFFFFIPN